MEIMVNYVETLPSPAVRKRPGRVSRDRLAAKRRESFFRKHLVPVCMAPLVSMKKTLFLFFRHAGNLHVPVFSAGDERPSAFF
jgi:hypothetical protein